MRRGPIKSLKTSEQKVMNICQSYNRREIILNKNQTYGVLWMDDTTYWRRNNFTTKQCLEENAINCPTLPCPLWLLDGISECMLIVILGLCTQQPTHPHTIHWKPLMTLSCGRTMTELPRWVTRQVDKCGWLIQS